MIALPVLTFMHDARARAIAFGPWNIVVADVVAKR